MSTSAVDIMRLMGRLPYEGQKSAERPCSEKGCDNPARNIKGYYTYNHRRVRVWTCDEHGEDNPLHELPVPESLRIAQEKDEAHVSRMDKVFRSLPRRPSESVRELSSTGHGPALRGDRVAAWRWGA